MDFFLHHSYHPSVCSFLTSLYNWRELGLWSGLGSGLRECCGLFDLLSRSLKLSPYQRLGCLLTFLSFFFLSFLCPLDSTLFTSFKKYSFTFITWLFGTRGLAFNIPFSLSFIVSGFWFKVRCAALPLTGTCRGHCRVISWPSFSIVVSQGIRDENGWLVEQLEHIQHLSIKFPMWHGCGLWHSKTVITVTSNITGHRSP